MRGKLAVFLMVAGGLFLFALPVLAHHGVQAYDNTKKITLKGTITSFEWTNPHSQIHMDVVDDKGNVVHWDFEDQPPSILVHAGWTRNTLKPGDVVTIIATPSKNGAPVGLFSKLILANGQELTATEQ